jgi:hypothetical protein
MGYDVIQKMLTSTDFQRDIVEIQTEYLLKLQELAARHSVTLPVLVALAHAPLSQMALKMEGNGTNDKEF